MNKRTFISLALENHSCRQNDNRIRKKCVMANSENLSRKTKSRDFQKDVFSYQTSIRKVLIFTKSSMSTNIEGYSH